MALVACHHLLAVSAPELDEMLGPYGLGRFGVTLFCGLSGYFSLRSRHTDAWSWIKRRLQRLYVPYWISLVVLFSAAALTHYKPLSAGLIVAQFLGIAGLTHGTGLVGVHVWFISLILLCYALAVVLRWKPTLFPLCLLFALFSLHWNPFYGEHLLSFLVGCVLSYLPHRQLALAASVAMSLVFVAAITAGFPFFVSPLGVILVLWVCQLPLGNSSPGLLLASEASYEFFLVHGPIYLVCARFLGMGLLLTLVCGTALALAATWGLRQASEAVSGSAARWAAWLAEWVRPRRTPAGDARLPKTTSQPLQEVGTPQG